jgi:hypothetical protein
VWVGHEFAGDDNQTLKDVQFRLYSVMLVRLFCCPRPVSCCVSLDPRRY